MSDLSKRKCPDCGCFLRVVTKTADRTVYECMNKTGNHDRGDYE